ncbi:DUF2291 domain-containing protein [Brachybacterium halotolerans subsp. kimchii]|uniref:DUF2291 domain-containing protein n=1 Tax=Brachybacterium halotolerans TaxID=2795215 RepID=A0ABS1BCL6_9MICO|nr:DUF2291 domain-containing protein [Brachybacterium halotolerans]MBK0332400.1 DUF2291 domain-containing protein [Brachybacterium halotolerans]UEJ84446.1 DUF2291 domain-containing protein [Brachybacterium halotolerans subsp. kimchii]
MTSTAPAARPAARRATLPKKRHLGRWIGVIIAVLAVILVVAGTKVVPDGQEVASGPAAFDKATYGPKTFPTIQKGIAEKAVAAPDLAASIEKDPEAAKKEGVESAGNTVYATTFTGKVHDCESGICEVAVDGMPKDVSVRMQVGPAINGTDLRDATGTLGFGQFTNQIEYQDAGAALNEEMKKQVLDPAGDLDGKTVTVTGAFTAINPQGWLVTPSDLEVS